MARVGLSERAPYASHRANRRTLARRLGLHSSGVKQAGLRIAHGVGTRAPERLVLAAVEGLGALARLAYPLPGHPLRRACSDLSAVAARAGHAHAPREIHARLVGQMVQVGRLYARLHHGGPEAVMPHLSMPPEQEKALGELRERHGAAVVVVPHNVGAVLYSMRIARAFPSLVIAKRSRSPWVCRLYEEGFRRMGVEGVLADRRRSFRAMRAVRVALAEGRVLVATVDYVSRKRDAATLSVFGQPARFDPWIYRVAQRQGIPVAPAWVSVDAGRIRVRLGPVVEAGDLAAAMREVWRFFEARFLEDPGSWAFLADKRWRALLRRAREARP